MRKYVFVIIVVLVTTKLAFRGEWLGFGLGIWLVMALVYEAYLVRQLLKALDCWGRATEMAREHWDMYVEVLREQDGQRR